jgi:hypothetical protein
VFTLAEQIRKANEEFFADLNKNKAACKRWYQGHKQEHAKMVMKNRTEIRNLINQIKGSRCTICGTESSKTIALHQVDGKPHRSVYYFYRQEMKRDPELKDYVRLCYRCHQMVHWIIAILKDRTKEQQDKIVELGEHAVRR